MHGYCNTCAFMHNFTLTDVGVFLGINCVKGVTFSILQNFIQANRVALSRIHAPRFSLHQPLQTTACVHVHMTGNQTDTRLSVFGKNYFCQLILLFSLFLLLFQLTFIFIYSIFSKKKFQF